MGVDSSVALIRTLQDLLRRASVGVTPSARGITSAYDRDSLVLDDAVLIVPSPGFEGWSDPSQIRVLGFSPNERLIRRPTPQELADLEKRYGPIKRPQWDEAKFTILKWERRCENNQGVLALQFGQSSTEENAVIEFMATHPVVKIANDDYTLYEAYRTKLFDFWTHLPNLATVTPVIVTSDNRLLATKRSARVYYYPSHWEISISEQMNPERPSDRDRFVFGAIERAVEEEVGSLEMSDVRVLGIYREASVLNVNFAALVKLSASEDGVRQTMRRAADAEEHSTIEFRDWNPENSTSLLLNPCYEAVQSRELSGPLHPSSRMRLLLAMLADFPIETVLSAVARISNLRQSDDSSNTPDPPGRLSGRER